jgi:hypothetical protein
VSCHERPPENRCTFNHRSTDHPALNGCAWGHQWIFDIVQSGKHSPVRHESKPTTKVSKNTKSWDIEKREVHHGGRVIT